MLLKMLSVGAFIVPFALNPKYVTYLLNPYPPYEMFS